MSTGQPLFDRTLRYYGQAVAAVAADTEEIAEDALREIEVDYQPTGRGSPGEGDCRGDGSHSRDAPGRSRARSADQSENDQRCVRDLRRGRSVQIGALTRLRDVATHPLIQSNFRCLADAIRDAASPQIRNVATLGGNLCQESRCWYFRGPFACWLKGGICCDAEHGDNRHQAIFGGGPCYIVHPSDPATALTALNASLLILGVDGERTVSVQDFFTIPHDNHRSLNALEPGELVRRIDVPWPSSGERSIFLKSMDRAAFSFALASVVCVLKLEADRISRARLVFGGVAPIPWRVLGCERALIGHPLDDQTIERATAVVTRGARPLSMNGYKVPLLRGLVERALRQLRE